MALTADSARGLTATELAAAVAELQARLAGSVVADVAMLAQSDDLLLFLQHEQRRHCLHLAPGGNRARATLTTRRFQKAEFATGPRPDALRRHLGGAMLLRIVQSPGERRCTFWFATAGGEQRLEFELFSARGLWALVDSEGRLRELSRPVVTAVRKLGPGDAYVPPPAAAATAAPLPDRFAAPVLAAIDLHFTAQDRAVSAASQHDVLQRAIARGLQKQRAIQEGLERQLQEGASAEQIRAEADLMLAYAHAVPRGATELLVPDPLHDDRELRIELDPARPITLQAKARYDRARRLTDGAAMTQQRLADANRMAGRCTALQQQLATADADGLAAIAAELQQLGLLPRPKAAATAHGRKASPPGENFRRFVSIEGYQILVGRNNEQNDRLSRSVASGNDLWLHVGGGRAGSHVVIRLPKGKTASLETLLDAGALAVHFSKARGERLLEVVYTLAKFVKKPKGLPPGAVIPSQTKTLAVRLDEARLARLLDSAGGDDR